MVGIHGQNQVKLTVIAAIHGLTQVKLLLCDISAPSFQILDEKMTDLLNPHNNPMTVRQHVIKGM